MVTIEQFIILDSCADEYEIYYILFSNVNLIGKGLINNRIGANVPSSSISNDIITLTKLGFLKCRRIIDEKHFEDIPLPRINDFSVYSDYNCKTFDEHISTFGYGPHEFKTTETGLVELHKPEYQSYCEKLGWIE